MRLSFWSIALLTFAGIAFVFYVVMRVDRAYERVAAQKESVAIQSPTNNQPAEPSSITQPSAQAPELAIQVLHSDNTPAHGALLVLFRQSEVLARGFADMQGKARFSPLRQDAEIVIAGVHYRPYIGAVPAGPGQISIQLATGAIFSGKVLVNDLPPTEPIHLSFSWEGKRKALQNFYALPQAVILALTRDGSYDLFSQDTDKEGNFRFGGLPFHWQGYVNIPFGYQLPTGETALPLHSLQDPVELRLIELPHLQAKVLISEQTDSVSVMPITYQVYYAEQKKYEFTAYAQADGHLRIPLMGDKLDTIKLAQRFNNGIKLSNLKIVNSEVREEIELAAPMEWNFVNNVYEIAIPIPFAKKQIQGLIRDNQSNLLSGVKINLTPQNCPITYSTVTDAAGRYEFSQSFLSAAASLEIQMPGYVRIWEPEKNLSVQETWDYQLSTGRNLEVIVRDTHGQLAKSGSLQVEDQYGWQNFAKQLSNGNFLLQDIPTHAVTLHYSIFGHNFSKVVSEHDSAVVIEIPSYGSVSLHWDFPVFPGRTYAVTFRSSAGIEHNVWLWRERVENNTIELPIVFAGEYSVQLLEKDSRRGALSKVGREQHVLIKPKQHIIVELKN